MVEMRHGKNTEEQVGAPRLAKTIVVAGLIAGIMTATSGQAQAEEKTNGRIFANAYDHARSTSVGAGIARGFELPCKLRIDASIAISSPGKGVDLENAELDLTSPDIGPVSLTTYIYTDKFYYTDRGLGAMLNFGNLHIATEYDGGGLGLSFAKYKFKLAEDKVRLVPQIGALYTDDKVVAMGGQLAGEADIGGVTIFAKAVHFRSPQNGQWMNGNMQGGIRFSF